ncbi:MAG: restriction endonuclease subunit S [Desulfobulbaceae bacterium]|nr:restriction endonuclease subunit S [Desulfobulbaceae bacterium]
MGGEWPNYCLGDLIEIKHGWAFKGTFMDETRNEGPIVVAIGNFEYTGGFRFGSTKLKRYTADFPVEYQLKPDDILLAMTCQTSGGEILGIPGVIPDDHNNYLHNQRLGKVVIKQPAKVSKKYLYWLFLTREFNHYLFSTATGTKILHTSPSRITLFNCLLPPLEEQQQIANMLWAIQSRIELNRRMNETLEGMAQALFKSWFVDFDPVIDNALASGKEIPENLRERARVRAALGDKRRPLPEEIRTLFPDEFTYSDELGWIPLGWKTGIVDDILNRLKVKKRYNKKEVADYGITPVYEQGSNLLLGYHVGVADIEATPEEPAFIFGDHTCVTKLTCEPFSISQNVIPLKGKLYPTNWVYYAIQGKQLFEEYRRHWKELIIKSVIIPPVGLGKCYDLLVKDWSMKKMAISHQHATLTKLRDTLLPKLLSGELRIPDAEKMVEELAL